MLTTRTKSHRFRKDAKIYYFSYSKNVTILRENFNNKVELIYHSAWPKNRSIRFSLTSFFWWGNREDKMKDDIQNGILQFLHGFPLLGSYFNNNSGKTKYAIAIPPTTPPLPFTWWHFDPPALFHLCSM